MVEANRLRAVISGIVVRLINISFQFKRFSGSFRRVKEERFVEIQVWNQGCDDH